VRRVTEKELQHVLRLEGPQRFEYFVKFVVDTEVAWGLRDARGWSAVGDDAGRVLLPLWPAREYAEGYQAARRLPGQPAQISLEDLVERMLPGLRSEGSLIAVFPTPSGRGIPLTADELLGALNDEKAKYGEA
jgi:hypothetical protein